MRSSHAQRGTGHEIADENWQPAQIRDFVDGHDARMSKLRDRPRLAVEPRDVPGGFDQVGVRDLECDNPLQTHVERAPHSPESANADPLDELELAELSTPKILGWKRARARNLPGFVRAGPPRGSRPRRRGDPEPARQEATSR